MSAPTSATMAPFGGAAVQASRLVREDYIAGVDPNNVTNLFGWKESHTAGNSDFLASKTGGDSDTPAWICVIGTIVPDRPHLKPRGNWSPNYNKPLQDAKLQFSLGSATTVSAHLGSDFDKAVNIVKVLQHQGGSTGNHRFFLGEYRNRPIMRLSFPLFGPRDTEFDPNNTADPSINYPVGDDLKDLLLSAAKTHAINPLPFYDENAVPMKPNFLEQQLMGAVVEVWFSFHHYSMGQQGKPPTSDTFVGRVKQLRVLRKPAGPGSVGAAARRAIGPGVMYIPPSRAPSTPATVLVHQVAAAPPSTTPSVPGPSNNTTAASHALPTPTAPFNNAAGALVYTTFPQTAFPAASTNITDQQRVEPTPGAGSIAAPNPSISAQPAVHGSVPDAVAPVVTLAAQGTPTLPRSDPEMVPASTTAQAATPLSVVSTPAISATASGSPGCTTLGPVVNPAPPQTPPPQPHAANPLLYPTPPAVVQYGSVEGFYATAPAKTTPGLIPHEAPLTPLTLLPELSGPLTPLGSPSSLLGLHGQPIDATAQHTPSDGSSGPAASVFASAGPTGLSSPIDLNIGVTGPEMVPVGVAGTGTEGSGKRKAADDLGGMATRSKKGKGVAN